MTFGLAGLKGGWEGLTSPRTFGEHFGKLKFNIPPRPRAPVRFGYGLGMEQFERFRFSVPAVPPQKGFSCVSGRFRFRFLENGSGGSGSLSVSGKTVPVSGSGSVPEPHCFQIFFRHLGHRSLLLGCPMIFKIFDSKR